jgi:hypothetical protein
MFRVAVGLEQVPPSFARINEELPERKSSGSGQKKVRLTAVRVPPR